MSLRFLALEIRRVTRSPRFMIFTVAFPVLLFLLYVSLFAKQPAEKAVLMVSMTAFGAMTAAMFTGTRVALERAAGWQRQLRLTPLSGAGYLTAKATTGMTLALAPAIFVPLVALVAEGVSLDGAGWV
ncbi:ABC transporter permease, partial [Amycolatopsis acidiphila]